MRAALAGPGITYGGWCSIPSSFSAEIMGHAGFDWICIDMQHGLIFGDVVVAMLQALSVTRTPALVRVPMNDPSWIMKALDAGADGVICPMVNTPKDASTAVEACRYPPDGVRSYGPTRAALVLPAASLADTNGRVACAVMVETADAVANLDEIVRVPGVDAVFVGPADLSSSLFHVPDRFDEPGFTRALRETVLVAERNGVVPGIFCGTMEAAEAWRAMGFRMLAVQSDVRFLRIAAADALRRLRARSAGTFTPDSTGHA